MLFRNTGRQGACLDCVLLGSVYRVSSYFFAQNVLPSNLKTSNRQNGS